MRACMRACVRACMRACVHRYVCTNADGSPSVLGRYAPPRPLPPAPNPPSAFIIGHTCVGATRNGSDYSGTIFGALLRSIHVTIWTDVDGVYRRVASRGGRGGCAAVPRTASRAVARCAALHAALCGADPSGVGGRRRTHLGGTAKARCVGHRRAQPGHRRRMRPCACTRETGGASRGYGGAWPARIRGECPRPSCSTSCGTRRRPSSRTSAPRCAGPARDRRLEPCPECPHNRTVQGPPPLAAPAPCPCQVRRLGPRTLPAPQREHTVGQTLDRPHCVCVRARALCTSFRPIRSGMARPAHRTLRALRGRGLTDAAIRSGHTAVRAVGIGVRAFIRGSGKRSIRRERAGGWGRVRCSTRRRWGR